MDAPMDASMLLIAHGPDQPGVMDDLSQCIVDHRLNVRDSRVINLGGQFAMLMTVSGDDAALTSFRERLPQCGRRLGVETHFADAAAAAPRDALPYRLRASGRDRAGVLNRLSHLLRVLQVNIESLESEVAPAEAGGCFTLTMLLSVPRHVPIPKLREYLDQVFSELDAELSFAPA